MEPKTPQEQMKERLEKSGIPYKEIKVYGSQIMITCLSYDAACKWAEKLTPICRQLRCGEGLDQTAASKGKKPEYIKVRRVWGTV